MSSVNNSRTRSAIRFPERSTRRSRVRDLAPATEVVASIVPRISIALVHQNAIARQGLALLLSQQPDMDVVTAGRNELNGVPSSPPDVVLLAMGGNDRDAMQEASTVLAAAPDARVIVIGPVASCVDLARQVQAEVSGFVLDDASLDDLLRTVRSVAEGTHVWPPAIAKSLFSQLSRDGGRTPTSASAGPNMTPREREVMGLIADGLSTKEIARQLGVASFTVRAHVRNIMEKLNIHTRLQIAAHVHRERAGQPGTPAPSPAPAFGTDASPMAARAPRLAQRAM